MLGSELGSSVGAASTLNCWPQYHIFCSKTIKNYFYLASLKCRYIIVNCGHQDLHHLLYPPTLHQVSPVRGDTVQLCVTFFLHSMFK